jgi:2-polyprenyl-3-methyl-5-hydroxy-6-metoxy-1,4-benzoquinol methylase
VFAATAHIIKPEEQHYMKRAIKPPTEVGELFIAVAHAEKYQSGNWIASRLVNNFLKTILQTVQQAGSIEVFEIGCGEGHILGMLSRNQFQVRGCDVSETSLAVAKAESERLKMNFPLEIKSIYDLDPATDSADTILCCEVLEHLTDPDEALRKLISVTRKDLILSVPREPVWHLLNLARGKYWHALGNTPGHFQHWTKKMFIDFVNPHAEIVAVKSPLPWTVIHCRPKKAD